MILEFWGTLGSCSPNTPQTHGPFHWTPRKHLDNDTSWDGSDHLCRHFFVGCGITNRCRPPSKQHKACIRFTFAGLLNRRNRKGRSNKRKPDPEPSNVKRSQAKHTAHPKPQAPFILCLRQQHQTRPSSSLQGLVTEPSLSSSVWEQPGPSNCFLIIIDSPNKKPVQPKKERRSAPGLCTLWESTAPVPSEPSIAADFATATRSRAFGQGHHVRSVGKAHFRALRPHSVAIPKGSEYTCAMPTSGRTVSTWDLPWATCSLEN